MVARRLWLASLRYLLRHRWQTGLSICGITLGVAVVVAVDLANHSADRGFKLSIQEITGRTSHQIVGGPEGIDERFYVELRLRRGIRNSAPVVEGIARAGGQNMTLLGLDPLAEQSFRTLSPAAGGAQLRILLTRPDAVLMAATSARRLGLEPGASLVLEIAGREHRVYLAGLIEHDNSAAVDGLLVTDISIAQELLGRTGRLDRIDLILRQPQADRLQRSLPPGLKLVQASRRSAALGRMSEAFQTNLAAMSLLALLVGGFLIYNSMLFSVLQRRELLGGLRLLGITRGELFGLVLLEAMVIGLLGTLLGLVGGVALGQGLVRLVTRTINDLYFVLTVNQLSVSPGLLLKGIVLGMLATLSAALGPAWEAAAARPQQSGRRSVIERRSHRAVPWLLAGGALLMVAGLSLVGVSSRSLTLGFAALFLVIFGYALLLPALVLPATRLFTPLLKRLFGILGRLAARGIGAALSRTGPALAALTLAVAATVGMGFMVESFRSTLAAWLVQTLQGDIYVSIQQSASRNAGTPLPEQAPALVRAQPGVARISMGRQVRVEGPAGPVNLLAITMATDSYRGFRFKGETVPDLWSGFDAGTTLLVSEPYAYRHGLRPGDSLALMTASGNLSFQVGAIFYDYGSDQGMLVMEGGHYAELWQDPAVATIGVFLQPEADPDRVINGLRTSLHGLDPRLQVRANREIRQYSMAVFDRTFTITRVLRLLVVGVAFIGILNALMALQLERSREHAILRASGMTPGQLLALICLQTGLLGLLAGLFALPLGWLMGELLIQVINLRAFGWTLQPLLPPGVLLDALLLAMVSALLAGIYPGLRMARTPPAEALRDE